MSLRFSWKSWFVGGPPAPANPGGPWSPPAPCWPACPGTWACWGCCCCCWPCWPALLFAHEGRPKTFGKQNSKLRIHSKPDRNQSKLTVWSSDTVLCLLWFSLQHTLHVHKQKVAKISDNKNKQLCIQNYLVRGVVRGVLLGGFSPLTLPESLDSDPEENGKRYELLSSTLLDFKS